MVRIKSSHAIANAPSKLASYTLFQFESSRKLAHGVFCRYEGAVIHHMPAPNDENWCAGEMLREFAGQSWHLSLVHLP